MPRPRTLRRQLLVWLVGPLAVLWSVSTVVDYDIANRFVNLAYDRGLLDNALDIGRQVKVLNGQIYVDLPKVAIDMLESGEQGRVYYLVTGPEGEYVTGEPGLPAPPDPFSGKVNYYDGDYDGKPVRVVAVQLPVESGKEQGFVLVQVAESRAARVEFAQLIMIRMMLPQAILIVLTALLVWYAVGRGLAPLASLQREIASRSHRDLSALPEEQAPREVQPLIRAMNGLLERLGRAITAQQRFVADAAHQLRTPIAGIKTQTELALRQTQSQEAQAALKQLEAATEQTTRLVNQLLSLARAEPSAGRAHATERLDLAQLARDATTEWVPRALARDIDLGFEGPSNGERVEGDPFLLKEMLNNLLDNAVRYTQSGGAVTMRVIPDAREVALSVEDNGPGIPESERERVFERFGRVLGTGVDGCGLGLAIVREIAQCHGAEAVLTGGAHGAGTVVRVAFARAA